MIQEIKKFFGFETVEEKLQRYDEVKKSFSEVNSEIDELAKDFYIEKTLHDQRLLEPDNKSIQDKINEKFAIYLSEHKSRIRKAKKSYDSAKKEIELIEKSLTNHKYIRKEPDGKGGWNYIYEENLINRRKGSFKEVFDLKNDKDLILKTGPGTIEEAKIFKKNPEYSPKVFEINEDSDPKYAVFEKLDVESARKDFEEFINRDRGYVHNWGVNIFKNNKKYKEVYDKLTTKKGRDMFERVRDIVIALDMKDIHSRNFGYDKDGNLKAIDIRDEDEVQKSIDSYQTIKKAYQNRIISLDSFNTVIKSLTKETKTKYSDFILFNEKGEILITKRSTWETSNAGSWVIPGGHVDPGEDHKIAAIRELQEETGYTVEDCENVGSYDDENCHIEYFQAQIDSTMQLPVVQWEEVRDLQWIPLNEVKEYDFVFNMKQNIMQILGLKEDHKEIIRKAIIEGIIPLDKVSQVIEKAKSGIYKLTPENKKLGRVGQKYGEKKEDTEQEDFLDFANNKTKASKFYIKDSLKSKMYLRQRLDIWASVSKYKSLSFNKIRKFNTDKDKFLSNIENEATREIVEDQFTKYSNDISKFIEDNKIKKSLTLYRNIDVESVDKIRFSLNREFEDKSFMSTSLVEQKRFGNFKMIIFCKKGSRVSCSDNQNELEYLIDKNSKFKVIELNDMEVKLKLL